MVSELARDIVRELLHTEVGDGDRLAVKQKQPDGTERDLGGRVDWAAQQTVQRTIDFHVLKFLAEQQGSG